MRLSNLINTIESALTSPQARALIHTAGVLAVQVPVIAGSALYAAATVTCSKTSKLAKDTYVDALMKCSDEELAQLHAGAKLANDDVWTARFASEIYDRRNAPCAAHATTH